MDATRDLKAELPSRDVTDGPERVLHRSHLMLTRAQMHQSFVGTATRWQEVALGSIAPKVDVFKRTPSVPDLEPGGRYLAKDMSEAGAVSLLVRTLLDHRQFQGECLTVTGRAVTENLKQAQRNTDQDVVRPADQPLSATGGVVGLKGNLAPKGEKVAWMADLRFAGPARCFDGEEACFDAVNKKKHKEGDVLVIRYEGPEVGPGMREMLATSVALCGRAMVGKAALITEGRSPGATRGCSLGHVAARIIEWPIAPIGNDDIIINAAKGAVAVKLGATEFDVAARAWKPHELRFTSGPACNAEQVGPTLAVSATHPYVKPEKACYADI